MKKLIAAILTLVVICEFTTPGHAQLKVQPSGGNRRASVYEQVGLTDINIVYNRPHVNGREGQIWGKLVPVGYVDQGFGTSKAAPWRAGANESTSIQFSTDVKIEGQPLAAGKYGFFIAYDPQGCTLIFSKNSSSWGSFYYNQTEDALRVKVKPVPADKSIEWLRYEFTNQTDNSATVQLEWEKLIIPFKVEVDLNQNIIAAFRKQLRTETGFTWQPWDQAAQYCALHKTNLEEGLMWADSATSVGFGGSHSFTAWSTKAAILDSLGRGAEAIATMKKALPYGEMVELYVYGRNLTRHKKGKEAFEVFKLAYDKSPDQFFSNVGMARGYSALGDYKKALPYALKARTQAPGGPNVATLDKMVKTLQEGKDIN